MCQGGLLNPNEPFGRHGLGAAGYLIPKQNKAEQDLPAGTTSQLSNRDKLKTNEST